MKKVIAILVILVVLALLAIVLLLRCSRPELTHKFVIWESVNQEETHKTFRFYKKISGESNLCFFIYIILYKIITSSKIKI